jgi:hypothetical protein
MRASSRRRSVAKASGSAQPRKRGGLIQGTDLALDERQVLERIEDQVLTLVRAGMAGDGLRAAADHHPVDVAADQDLAMAIGYRDGIVVAPVAHQRERTHPSRTLGPGVIGSRRQGQKRRPVSGHPGGDRFRVAAELGALAFTTTHL